MDLEATWQVIGAVAITLYYGHLFGGVVTRGAAGSGDVDYLISEITLSY